MKWIAIVQLVAFAITSSANAALKTWDGGGGNLLWTNATNWNPNGMPTAADDVVNDVSAQITVTLSANSTINSLLLIDDLTVSATATLTIASPSTVAGIMNLAPSTACLTLPTRRTTTF